MYVNDEGIQFGYLNVKIPPNKYLLEEKNVSAIYLYIYNMYYIIYLYISLYPRQLMN